MPRKPLRASRSRSLAASARTKLAACVGAGAFVLVPGLASARAAAASDLRLGTTVVPRSESLRLVLDPGQERYTGSATIELEVREAAPSFRLHAEELAIERCVLRRAGEGEPGKALGVEIETGPQGLVTLTPSTPLAPGDWVLEIEFGNDYSTRGTGLYRMQQDGESYLFTQFQADDARQAFPCFDEPGFKIPWQLDVVVPEAQLVLANTPIETESRAAGQRTVVFRRTPPLPSTSWRSPAAPSKPSRSPGSTSRVASSRCAASPIWPPRPCR
jgi:alanyl aminopeptidase